MADLTDLQSASDKHILNDDATPTLKLTNTNTTLSSYALEVNGMDLNVSASRIPAANATVISYNVAGASRASGAVLGFEAGALVSLTSVLSTTGGAAGTYGLRVLVGDGEFGWIPVYPDGAVTAAAL